MRHIRGQKENSFRNNPLLVLLLLVFAIITSIVILTVSGIGDSSASAVTSVTPRHLEAFGLSDLVR